MNLANFFKRSIKKFLANQIKINNSNINSKHIEKYDMIKFLQKSII